MTRFFPKPSELRVIEMGDGAFRLQQDVKGSWTNLLVSWSLPEILSYRLTVLGDSEHENTRNKIKNVLEIK